MCTEIKQIFLLISVSHLFGFGGFPKNLFLFVGQALYAGMMDLFENSIHLDLQIVLLGHSLFPAPGMEFEFKLFTPGL